MSTPATNPPATTPTNNAPTTPPTTQPTTPPTTPPTTNPTTPPTTQPSPTTTSVVTASTTIPTSTSIVTSVVTASNTQQTTAIPSSSNNAGTTPGQTTSTRASSNTATNAASTQRAQSSNSGGGLGTGGTVAIAVVIPLVVVALLIVLGIFLWRKRSQRMSDEEDRRKEMEAYGYNPNDDPSLRPIGTLKDEGMVQDDGGYRGWGGAAAISTSGRKTSTNASSVPGDYNGGAGWNGPSSPTHNPYAQELPASNSAHHRNGTMDSDVMGAMGTGAAAAGGLARQPSNASSTYSAGERERMSQDYHAQYGNEQPYQPDNTYYNPGPYDNPYHNMADQPVMRDSPARRLTQINEGGAQPQQGGISQNF